MLKYWQHLCFIVFFNPFNGVIIQIFLQLIFSFIKCKYFQVDMNLFDNLSLKVFLSSIRFHPMDAQETY